MKQRGFTIVELIVVITVMTILLILSVVNVRSSQIQARDNERHIDVANIAQVLESYYDMLVENRQHSYPASATSVTDSRMGPYDQAWTYIEKNTGTGSLYAPGVDAASADPSLVMATSASQAPSTLTPALQTDRYIYQALTADNGLCVYSSNTTCTKFNIYYRLEQPTDECPAPTNMCVHRSKNQ